jgi:hypothetical protein
MRVLAGGGNLQRHHAPVACAGALRRHPAG